MEEQQDIDIEHFRTVLEQERARLEKELEQIAQRNPGQADDWEVTAPDMNVQESDPSERSDRVEEYENRSGTELALEEELGRVRAALQRIASGTYGICTKEGGRIPRERLEANPSAETCITHQS